MLSMVIVPALLMVSTIRYRSFKTLDLQARRSYPVLFLVAVGTRGARLVAAVPVAGDGVYLPGVRVHRSRVAPASPPAASEGRERGDYWRSAGSEISTVVPWSRALWTVIVPPLSSTLRLAIGSPSPVPLALVEK